MENCICKAAKHWKPQELQWVGSFFADNHCECFNLLQHLKELGYQEGEDWTCFDDNVMFITLNGVAGLNTLLEK